MKLVDQLWAAIEATKDTVNDYDHRSAIGMARSWVDNQKPITWNADQIEYRNRDDLAKALVKLLEGHDYEAQIDALYEVRKRVNAPYLDPRMAGRNAAREKRGELLTPKGRKARTAAAAEK